MTNNPIFMPKTAPNRLVLFITYPDVGLLDLTGPQTAFWAASKYMKMRGLPSYELQTASLTGGIVHTAEGLDIQTRKLSEFETTQLHNIIVPGSPYIENVINQSTALTNWLTQAEPRADRIAAVCTGTFLLAQAGLLNNKRAATHWEKCNLLHRLFPNIEVDLNAIFIQQDKFWTSAGVSAGIDLALAIIEQDCGRQVCMQVARELVVFIKRSGGQAQFSELLQAQTLEHPAFEQLNLWISANLANSNLSVESLAMRVNMSPRNFARAYKEKTGRTPAKAVEVIRLESARRMLEDSEYNIDQIARLCGFGDEERMRITFQRHLATSPRTYRQHFSR